LIDEIAVVCLLTCHKQAENTDKLPSLSQGWVSQKEINL
jgi:hypothetical protein